MKVWIIRRIGRTNYDQHDGHVVLAPSEESAREIIATASGIEQPNIWRSRAFSTCLEVDAITEPGIVLSSFNAG